MATLDELLLRPPKPSSGIPIRKGGALWDSSFIWDVSAWDDIEGLRFVVEMAVPSPIGAAVWGTALWGIDRWTRPEWQDLTCRFQGVEFTQGGSPGGDDDPGELAIQLDNSDGRLLPWSANPFTSPAYMGAGTLMRVSVMTEGSDPVWWPQIVAIASGWEETRVAEGQASWITVPGFETMSRLARVRPFAVTPEGAADTATQRFTRLIEAAEWLYGTDTTPITSIQTYQATDLSAQRLSELRDLAASWDARFRSDRKGRATMARTGTVLVDDNDRPIVLSDRCGVVYPTLLRGVQTGVVSTPDAASLDLTGDITVILWASANWATGPPILLRKDGLIAGGYAMGGNPGTIGFIIHDGVAQRSMNSTATGFVDGGGYWIETYYDNTAKTCRFRVSTDPRDTPLDEIVRSTLSTSAPHGGGSPAATSAQMAVCESTSPNPNQPFVGRVLVISGDPDGTVVASPDFTAYVPGLPSFVDAQGNEWTIGQPSHLIADEELAERHIPYVTDSLETANNDDMVVAVVNVANEGGYEVVIDDALLLEQHGYIDTDVGLNVTTDIQAAVATDVAGRILARAAHVVRPLVCTLDSANGADVLDCIIRLHHDRKVHVQRPGVRFSDARICEASHAISPDGAGGIRWTVDVAFDVTVDYEWRAAA